ncbi:hypothetical protein EJ02DRAFT_338467, partial [Clathrospora elynae]
PLDVVMFKPLSTAYSTKLSTYLYKSQRIILVKKGDFFPLFQKAWITSFKWWSCILVTKEGERG